MNNDVVIIDKEKIQDKIYIIRGHKVMLDRDLALIYGYETRYFNRQVKNNIEKFDNDFMFQLTKNEFDGLKCKNFTSNWGGVRKLPFAFTEQGIYMLMTVLKGEMAIRQSKSLIRIFKEMKDCIIKANSSFQEKDILKLAMQINQNTCEIQKIKEDMITKSDLAGIINNFLPQKYLEELLILNGKTVEASIAYNNIYKQAKNRIFIIDNYISLKTLIMLKNINVQITIFSDNLFKGLTKMEYDEFKREYPDVTIYFRKTNGIFHDRYIIIDYKDESEMVYHCGASSKDSGKRINTITEIKDIKQYYELIDNILNNQELILK